MSALDVVRRLHQHRMWATGRVLDSVATLSPQACQQPHQIGQGTLWRTLMHMYAAEWVWLAALTGDENAVLPGDRADALPGNQQGDGGITSLARLRPAWAELDDLWRGYLEQLSESQLDEMVYKVSSLARTRLACRRLDVLLHVATHAHYTTAQAMNMLRHLGVASLPDPMLITMARQELAARDST